jgi:hypothetical protein
MTELTGDQLNAFRYIFLRRLAIEKGDLESFVALAQLDYCDMQAFDAAVDAGMAELFAESK